jgi:hypothetical protein
MSQPTSRRGCYRTVPKGFVNKLKWLVTPEPQGVALAMPEHVKQHTGDMREILPTVPRRVVGRPRR